MEVLGLRSPKNVGRLTLSCFLPLKSNLNRTLGRRLSTSILLLVTLNNIVAWAGFCLLPRSELIDRLMTPLTHPDVLKLKTNLSHLPVGLQEVTPLKVLSSRVDILKFVLTSLCYQ